MIRSSLPALFLVLAVSAAAAPDPDDLAPPAAERSEENRSAALRYLASTGREVREDIGDITAVDFDGPTITVAGLDYGFAPGARVRVDGVASAPTLLVPGMSVRFVHVEPERGPRAADVAGIIHELEDVDPARVVEE